MCHKELNQIKVSAEAVRSNMSKKDMDRRKKFILELMGDPIYQPMRLREISSLLRLSKRREKRAV